jgi:hypothetical protein
MKQGYCQSCVFDKHEIMGCAAMQLKWAAEQLFIDLPIIGKVFEADGFSTCQWFEPVDLGEE